MAGFDQVPLEETEDVRGVFYGGRGQVGGQLIVTNRRLLFGPIATALPKAIFGEVDVPVLSSVTKILDAYEPLKSRDVFLRHVVSVVKGRDAGFTGAPTIRIHLATEEVIEYGIVASTLTPNPMPSNNEARDRALAVIIDAVAKAKAASSTAS
jgi:hypothetical protein